MQQAMGTFVPQQPQTQRLAVQVPPGMSAGQTIQFPGPGGGAFTATIPPGVPVGGTFMVEVAAPPVALPQATGVPMGSVPMGSVPMGLPMQQSGPPNAMPYRGPPPRAASLYNVLTPGGAPAAPAPTAERPTAVKHAECPICFEPLHNAPVGVFLDPQGRRVSRHFFNLAAAREWLSSGNGNCPMTRAPVASVLPVPSILENPEGWFRACDIDGDGRLSMLEVVECLKAQLPVDNAALDAAAADRSHWMWQQWDSDGSGYIERNELLDPQGLAAYVRSAFARTSADAGPPDIRNKDAWYEFWDEDHSGSLEKEEVVRALLKTLKMTSDPAAVQRMRGTIDAIWAIFDDDGSGSIEKNEFLRPGDGLADTIIATMQYG
tara:strand:- start:3976 stop:5106 length:1131 start_codon:yes stop_codon:yes gene_type:complete